MASVAAGALADGQLTVSGSYDRVVEQRQERVEQQQTGTRQVTSPKSNPDGTPALLPALAADGTPLPDTDPTLYRNPAGALVQALDPAGAPMFAADGTTQVWTVQDTVTTEEPVFTDVTIVSYAHTATPIGGRSHTMLKDLVAPAAPTVFPPGGTYTGAQNVTATAADSGQETLHYTVAAGTAAEPAANSPQLPAPYAVTGSQQLKIAAYDRVGNRSATVTHDYVMKELGTPGAPTGVSGQPGNASATVSWTAPADDGGLPVTGYLVLAYDANGVLARAQDVPGQATSTVVSGLTNGSSYTFRVEARNSRGSSLASVSSAPVMPRTTPGAPRILAPTAGKGSAVVRWTAPEANGSPITGYRIRVYAGNRLVRTVDAPAGTSFTVTGLANGTAHAFDVTAVNAVGAGGASGRSAAVTPRSEFVAPTVSARSPRAGATKVKRGADVAIRFSEAVKGINSATVRVTRASNGAVVPGTLSYNARTRTVTFNPYGRTRGKLAANTKYRVTVTSGIKDGAGNALKATSWTFTTGRS